MWTALFPFMNPSQYHWPLLSSLPAVPPGPRLHAPSSIGLPPHHVPITSQPVFGRRPLQQFGDPEIGDWHLPFAIQDDVLGLDNPMHHAVVVSKLQRLADFRATSRSRAG
jgi:hypothetical protein